MATHISWLLLFVHTIQRTLVVTFASGNIEDVFVRKAKVYRVVKLYSLILALVVIWILKHQVSYTRQFKIHMRDIILTSPTQF